MSEKSKPLDACVCHYEDGERMWRNPKCPQHPADALTSAPAELREALEYYADPETWKSDDDGIRSATEDEGEIARAALASATVGGAPDDSIRDVPSRRTRSWSNEELRSSAAQVTPGTCPECRGTGTWGETSDCPVCHGTGNV